MKLSRVPGCIRSIRDDDRGAIMVLGAFLAPFLVGALYYFIACGNVVMQREGLQNAADASAFSASVVSARAMNAIAVMNVLMTTIMTIVIPVRALVPAYATVASFGCDDTCTCTRVADAARAAADLGQKSVAIERRARDLLTALSDAQEALAAEVPDLAETAATRSAERTPATLKTPQRAEIFSPSRSEQGCRLGLPVEEDDFRQVCKRTRPYVWEIALRIAGPTTLNTIGPCLSGPWALGLASPKLSNPEGSVCREAASPPCSGGGPHPKKVFREAKNGNDYMQYWSRLSGRPFDFARTGVEVGSRKKGTEPLSTLNIGFAQSEIYFDCSGAWASPACNYDEEAMWNTRWTARLRRVHKPTISFADDAVVKQVLTNASYWAGIRRPLAAVRRDPIAGGPATTEAANLVRSSEEGPLQ